MDILIYQAVRMFIFVMAGSIQGLTVSVKQKPHLVIQ
jgi:hypothetical protein